MKILKSIAVVSVCSLVFIGSASADNLSQGEAIFKEILEKVINEKQLGCRMNFDASGMQGGRSMAFAGKVKLAFDSRNSANEKRKIDIDTTIGQNPVKVVINSEARDFYFVANLPGHPPMAYHHDGSGATAAGKAPKGFATNAHDFGGSGNPLSSVMGSVGEGMTPEKRKALASDTVTKVKSKSKIVFIAPNCLKFIPTDGEKTTTKLYFNTSTKLIQTVLVDNPEKNMNGKLTFSDWILGKPVDTALAKPRMSYKEFDQQAMSKLLGAGMSAFAGAAGGSQPSGGASGMPTFTMPAMPNFQQPKSTAAPSAKTAPSGFTFPSFGGAITTPDTRTTSGNTNSAAEAMEDSLNQGTKGLADLMKAFNSEDFKKQMQKVKEAAQAAEAQLQSPEFKRKMEEAKRAVNQGQAAASTPEGQAKLEKVNEDLQKMQKALQEQMNAIMGGSQEK